MQHEIIRFWWFLQSITGIDNTAGRAYSFWSGFGSDLTEIALLFGIFGLYKHHNCAVPRCPRIARKHWNIKGTPLHTCHHHATKRWHNLLKKQYKEDYPDQHELLNI